MTQHHNMNPKAAKKILVSGASGFVGKHLSDFLKDQGHDIFSLTRSPKHDHDLAWDVLHRKIDLQKMEGFDAVIHLAGENIASGYWTEEKKRAIADSRVEGTAFLIQTLEKCTRKPSVWINASAIGYYGDRDDEMLTEASSPGDSFLAKVCKSWEAQAQKCRTWPCRDVQLRFGIVLGPDGGALSKMLPTFSKGLGGKLGDGKQYMSWIEIDDLVSMISFCLSDDRTCGPINACSPNPVRNEDFTLALSHALDKPTLFRVPKLAVKAILGEGADEAFASTRVIPKKMLELGFEFQYPTIESAMKRVVGQLR
ncbi:MAG: TIGR01777 family oxidoreductase [Bdellovibrionota bacterium]